MNQLIIKINSPAWRQKMTGILMAVVLVMSPVNSAKAIEISTSTANWSQASMDQGFVIPPKVIRTYKTELTAYNSEENQCDSSPYTTADGSDVRHGTEFTRHDDANHEKYLARMAKGKEVLEMPVDGIVSIPFLPTNQSINISGIVATNILPFGTQVRIPQLFGNQIFEVHDRMNPRYANRMDIWVADEGGMTAKEFGLRRNVTIEIIKMGTGEKQWASQPIDIAYFKK